MSKESAKKVLSVFKWFNIIGAVIMAIVAVVVFVSTDSEFLAQLTASIKTENLNGLSPATYLGIVLIARATFSLIEAMLFSRVIKDGRKSTLLMVLLGLSTVSNVYNLITAFSSSEVISLCLTLLTLYSVYVLRKEA